MKLPVTLREREKEKGKVRVFWGLFRLFSLFSLSFSL